MSENQSLRVPSCRRHKPSGQAAVTVNGQDICPGTWNTWASKAEYNRLIAEFLTHGRQLQSGVQQTVVEVLNAYRAFAENDYRKGDQVTREYSGIKDALKLVRELYGRTIANDFGPLALKTVRTRKIETNGWRALHHRKLPTGNPSGLQSCLSGPGAALPRRW